VLVDGTCPAGADRDRLIFGPYFLVPFGLAVAVLLLEIGLVSCRRGVLRAALAAPAVLVVLALVGHRPDPIYRGFLDAFSGRLGVDPLSLALLASAGFYGYAALRRVPLATEALTAALAALAFVGPDTLRLGELVRPQPVPILVAAVLQLGLGLRGRSSGRCLIGAGGLMAAAALGFPGEDGGSLPHGLIAFHLALIAVLVVGAVFNDPLGRVLRVVGPVLVLVACSVALFGRFDLPEGLPPWVIGAYPPVMAVLLTGYGLLLGHWPARAIAALVLACWVAAVGWWGYWSLRQIVAGLDHIA